MAFGFHSSGSGMASSISPLRQPPPIAILVVVSGNRVMLSPFFAKSDGLLVLDLAAATRSFQPNNQRTGQATCGLVLRSGVNRFICSFVAVPERDRLLEAGLDVRIGSCSCPVVDLARDFDGLPTA